MINQMLLILCFAGQAAAWIQKTSTNNDLIATAVYTENAPRIDAILNEPFWRQIEPIRAFKQREPNEGAEPSERTEVRIAYDEDNLYFGLTMYDQEPSKIRKSILHREGRIDQDDRVIIGLDTYRDRRNAYIFELNAFGTQGDALISDEQIRREDWNWEGIYESEGRVTEFGWVLEVAIPFTTIRFAHDEAPEMGIAFYRSIRRKNEEVYWPLIGLDYGDIWQVSQYATLRGLRNLNRGRNLQIKPYGITGAQKLAAEDEDSGTVSDAGVDIKYGITSNLTMDLTYNTDFAQVEADNVQINLTRFNLRFPEKREFFLERAGLFSFGSRGTETFFSRRVGISNEILGGGRLTGQLGPLSIGLLDLQTRKNDDGPGANFAVARLRSDIWPRATVGAIFTNRENDEAFNRAFGGDFAVRFWQNSSLNAWFTNVWSSEEYGTSGAGNIDLTLRNDLYRLEVGYLNVGKKFDPGIGFVQRLDLIRYQAEAAYSPRLGRGDQFIRQLTVSAEGSYIEGQDHEKQSTAMAGNFAVRFETGDRASVELERSFERLQEPFAIRDSTIIPSADYSFTSGGLSFRTNSSRRLSSSFNFGFGDFFHGTQTTFAARPTVKFSQHFTLGGSLSHSIIALPVDNGDFSSTIFGVNIGLAASRKLFANTLIQYDNFSKRLQTNIRIDWIHTPGSDLFIVLDTSYLFPDGIDFRESNLDNRVGVVKLTYNFAL